MKDLIIEEAEILAKERYGVDYYTLPFTARLALMEDALEVVQSRATVTSAINQLNLEAKG